MSLFIFVLGCEEEKKIYETALYEDKIEFPFEEIDNAVSVITKVNPKLVLMACTLSYPTEYDDANLMRIKTLNPSAILSWIETLPIGMAS